MAFVGSSRSAGAELFTAKKVVTAALSAKTQSRKWKTASRNWKKGWQSLRVLSRRDEGMTKEQLDEIRRLTGERYTCSDKTWKKKVNDLLAYIEELQGERHKWCHACEAKKLAARQSPPATEKG